MFLYIVVGMTRQGKSRYVKAMIKHPEAAKKPCFVFDYQNEYGDTYFTDINNKIVEVPGVGLQPYRPGRLGVALKNLRPLPVKRQRTKTGKMLG